MGGMELRNLVHMLCDRVIKEKDHLTHFDQATGDGDFGVNMERGCQAIIGCLDKAQRSEDGEDILRLVGKTLNAAGCGTGGTLISAGILAGASHIGDLKGFLEAALERIRLAGKANPGQKTLVDALSPAVDALKRGAELEEVVRAAKTGAEATQSMEGTLGRALYSQSRGRGIADPGAWLVGVLFDEGLHWQRSQKGSEIEKNH